MIIMKKILKIIKRIILAFCIIYGFNLIGIGLNITIPINLVTIILVTCLDFSGLLSLIGIYLVLL